MQELYLEYMAMLHIHKYYNYNSNGYFFRLVSIQNMSAVTAACLMIKTKIYKELNGLDEINLEVAFNDVDFCLRVQENGYKNIFTPYCEAYHYESISRGKENTPIKMDRFKRESEISKRIDNYVRIYKNLEDNEVIDYSKIDFSELCDFLEFIELREYGAGERYKDYGSREKISLRYYLSKTISEKTPYEDIPDIYIKFAEQLHDKDIVLSFNKSR